MHTRQNALNEWLKSLFNETPLTLTPLAGDASFRRYYRLQYQGHCRIVMDAPPHVEGLAAFVNIAATLAQQGIHTPTIYAMDATQGFLLLEDLGDLLFRQALSSENANAYYQAAMTTLLHIQQCPVTALPHFDKKHIESELDLFRTWFLKAYLGLELTAAEEQWLTKTFDALITEINHQPRVFIHRDYHSRNLMVMNASIAQHQNPIQLGVIDFQDAMCGPLAYDLVSLLKDSYVQWPREQITQWVAYFHQHLNPSTPYSLKDFTRAFDICGLQRHLKILGIFCRLHLRDNKSNYLRDLPLTFNYLMGCLERYEDFEPLQQFIQQRVLRVFLDKQLDKQS